MVNAAQERSRAAGQTWRLCALIDRPRSLVWGEFWGLQAERDLAEVGLFDRAMSGCRIGHCEGLVDDKLQVTLFKQG